MRGPFHDPNDPDTIFLQISSRFLPDLVIPAISCPVKLYS
jgi:hypothetical protein